jgi:hypothetical protein
MFFKQKVVYGVIFILEKQRYKQLIVVQEIIQKLTNYMVHRYRYDYENISTLEDLYGQKRLKEKK